MNRYWKCVSRPLQAAIGVGKMNIELGQVEVELDWLQIDVGKVLVGLCQVEIEYDWPHIESASILWLHCTFLYHLLIQKPILQLRHKRKLRCGYEL